MSDRSPRLSRGAQMVRFWRVARLLLRTIWIIYRERRRVLRARERGDDEVQPRVEVLIDVLTHFRKAALDLGVLMIKLGQFLSSRADLLPERALAVLADLQDEVPAAAFEHVRAVIEEEFGQPLDSLFSEFQSDATAAASLGQVHRAVLASTGQIVAVKVQRPHIEQLVESDLSTIRFVIWVVSRFADTRGFFDLPGFYREFRRTILEEIDYVREAENAERFREMFAGRDGVYIPAVVDGCARRRVLVLEWVDGIKINDYAALEGAGVNRLAAATRAVEAYLYQFFEAGFFHADPHPGNIFVQPRGDGLAPRIAFVDFGMVGRLTKGQKQGLKDLFLGFLVNDAHGMAVAMERLGFIGEGANMAAIERGMALMMSQYSGISLGEARDLDFSDVAHEVEDLLYRQPFRIPAEFAFTGKAVGTLSGVATGLAPEMNLIDTAVPYARRFLGLSSDRAGEALDQIARQLLEAGRVLLGLPATVNRVLTKFETGQIEVRVAEAQAQRRRSRRRGPIRSRSGATAANGLSAAGLCLAGMAGGGLLAANHLAAPSWFCFGMAAASLLAWALRG